MGPEMGSFGEAGVVWVSRGRVCETWASPVWVVVGVCETGGARAFRSCPSGGACPAAGVVWVSVGCVCETWASRACFMAPNMGSFGEAGVVWVSRGRAGVKQGWSGFQRGRGRAAAGVVWVSRGRGCAAARVVWVSAGACVKPGPPLSSETAPKTAHILQRGWSGFRGGVGAPQPGWFGFQRKRVCETWASRAFRNCPSGGAYRAAGVLGFSGGAG